MNNTALSPSTDPIAHGQHGSLSTPRHGTFRGSRVLTVFGCLMWIAMVPALIAWGLDERMLRGVSVWAKPLKFMASIGLFALCTAWFIGLLPEAKRRDGVVRGVVWVIVVAGSLEIAYITLMAGLGEASHYNRNTPLHMALYSLMGLGALAMTGTQPVLAWHIARHARADIAPAWRDSVVLGLVLTFVLGAGAGGVLGSVQPPPGTGLPLVGWHAAGDLRPAHFLGMHAQQFFPLAGALLATRQPTTARRLLAGFALIYVAVWIWAMVRGLDGAVFAPPYVPVT